MIDPKRVEFTPYHNIPHLLTPVIMDPKMATGALMWAVEEMEKRYDILAKLEMRNLDMYNETAKGNPALGQPMPKILIVIDELNDLMMQVRDPIESLILRITQKARAVGIHMIIGTQRPTPSVLTGVILANIPARICCKVADIEGSRAVLASGGAEGLLGRGDMLFSSPGTSEPMRVQGAFISDGELDNLTEFLRSENAGNVDREVSEKIARLASTCVKKRETSDGDMNSLFSDKCFLDAVEVTLRQGKVSTSLLQRKLSIGFGRAASYIDAMEALGVISEKDGQKPREVLVTREEWENILSEYM